ncbi:MAG: amidohydrolase family protein [Candidatus Latescibacterota bacterium]|jgi:predicted TIM-barrel fold metal-dependent hydrolase
MVKVDAHVHVFARHGDEYPREVSELAPAEREATAEQLLREMDASGIDRAVLIGMGGSRIEHHRYVTGCVARWPDRFTATGLVDADDPDPPARLRELVEATGIEGIRLGDLGDPQAARAEDLKTYALFQCAGELGLNVNVFTGGDQVPCLELLAAAFPQVSISLDHLGVMPTTPCLVDRWGRPRQDDESLPPPAYPRILALARLPNVYLKVSGEYAVSRDPWPYRDLKPMVEQAYRAYGAHRLMWCTDAPWVFPEPGYRSLVDLLARHLPALSREETDQIMGGTALRIWFRR